MREPPVEPGQRRSFAIHCNTPKMVRTVVHEEKVGSFSIDATHFVVLVLVLRSLNVLSISHLACPACGTAVSVMRLIDLRDPINERVYL
jgi:hypothetical protein